MLLVSFSHPSKNMLLQNEFHCPPSIRGAIQPPPNNIHRQVLEKRITEPKEHENQSVTFWLVVEPTDLKKIAIVKVG